MSDQDNLVLPYGYGTAVELMLARQAEARRARIASGEEMPFELVTKAYQPQPLFPASASTLVVWGLDGVLVNISKSIEAAYKVRTAEILAEMVPAGTAIDTAEINKLVHKGYEECGQPCKYVAAKYGVDEGTLQISMLARVAYKDVALNPNKYGMGDQGLLNYFEASTANGVKHATVTSATGNFATTCLHFAALTQYMSGIFGGETRRGNGGEILPKNVNPDDYLEMILPADDYKDRYSSVVVVDHNLDFLAAAQALGMKTVLIDPENKYSVKPSEADHMFNNPKCVFEKVLGIKDPGGRRDFHIYSGAVVSTMQPSMK